MKVVIVYGAPLSGKTTYVKENMTDKDIVFDYDAIAYAVTSNKYQDYNSNAQDMILTIRNTMIDYAKWNVEGTLFIITTFLSKKITKRIKSLGVTYESKRMNTGINICLERLDKSDRSDKNKVRELIHEWHEKLINKPISDRDVDAETKRFYNSKAWKETRAKVLQRDNFECQECKKVGKVSGNRPDKRKSLDVDHIKELETHPELAHDMDNLITLCVSCHNRKHNRYQKRFSKKNKWADDEIW